MKGILEATSFEEIESEQIHQLESWKNRYRIRRTEKKFQILLAQKTLSQEIDSLRALIEGRLEKLSKQKHIPVRNEGEIVYENYKAELESKHMDEIVAIDIANKKIVGYGKTPEEAYLKAKIQEPEQDQFYFRRVGSPYVEIL